MGLALALGLCAGSVYLCRKMNRELKQANAKHGATVDPPKDKPSFTLAKPSTPGTPDNGVELPSS